MPVTSNLTEQAFYPVAGSTLSQWCSGKIPESCNEQWISVLENVQMLCQDQAIELIIYNCHKGSIFHHKSLFNQKIDHFSSTKTASNTL